MCNAGVLSLGSDADDEVPAVPLKEKRIAWVDPVLVAEVEFRGWTGDGMLRHASYKGLRERADAASVFRREHE